MPLFGKIDKGEGFFKDAKQYSDPNKKECDLGKAIKLLEEAVMLKPGKKQYAQKLVEIREIEKKSQMRLYMRIRVVHGSATIETEASGLFIDAKVEQGMVRLRNIGPRFLTRREISLR